MRSIDATLSAALAAGNGKPIIKATIGLMDGTVNHTQDVISYKLTARALEFEWKYNSDLGGSQTGCWLERGITLNGVDYTITTGRFYIWSQTYLPNGRQKIVGGIFPKQYYSAAGDVTYQTAIDAICTAFGKSAVYKDAGAAWLAYKFLPAGKVIIMNDANNFFNMLRQKYLIFACDNGSEEIRFFALDASGFGAADETITVKADFDLQVSNLKNRQLLWRDETETIHTQGSADDPIHNLGYLESTASAPARMAPTYLMSAITHPRLDVQDGDTVSLVTTIATAKMFAQVTEQFGVGKDPRWMTLIEANQIYENTEGGALPSTIERVSNYTPLNTSMFNNNLSTADNNLQAAMDTIDDMVLGAGGGNSIQILGGHAQNATVPAGVSRYIVLYITGLVTSGSFIWPITSVLKNMYFATATAQPATGTMVVTLQDNNVDTAITATVPAGNAAGIFSDLVNSITLVPGHTFRFKFTNNAATASAQIGSVSIETDIPTV